MQVNISNWRGLDPCCGSGTFLTVMIDKVLEETKEKSRNEQLHEVNRNFTTCQHGSKFV